MKSPFLAPIVHYAGRLRFPALFLVTATLFVANALIPDPLPFVDEIVLALVALLLGSMRKGKSRDDRVKHEDEPR